MESLFFALWYLLPAGIGNMAPIFASKAPVLRDWCIPLDGGKTWRGKRIFGPHKTVRGLIVGIMAGILVGSLQMLLADDVKEFINLPNELYSGYTPLLLGGLLGSGALIGDAIESFAKRQIGVASGDSWFPFDQTDYIVGACIFGAVIYALSFGQYIWILIVWFGLHLLSSYVGFLLRLKTKPI